MNHSIVCIAGPSGGTGKSTIAKELALGCNSQGLKTCLVDLDLSGGTQNALFKVLPKKGILDWFLDCESCLHTLPIDSLAQHYCWDYIQQYLTLSTSGVYLLTAPADGNPHSLPADVFGTILCCLQSYFDILILDTSSNLDPVTTAAMANADHTLLVTTGDNTCVNNIRKLRRFIRGKDGDLSTFSLIVNRQPCSGHVCCQSPKQLETVLCLPVITVLPEDNHVWMYNNAGISILSGKPQTPLQKALQQLSQIIISTIAA